MLLFIFAGPIFIFEYFNNTHWLLHTNLHKGVPGVEWVVVLKIMQLSTLKSHCVHVTCDHIGSRGWLQRKSTSEIYPECDYKKTSELSSGEDIIWCRCTLVLFECIDHVELLTHCSCSSSTETPPRRMVIQHTSKGENISICILNFNYLAQI